MNILNILFIFMAMLLPINVNVNGGNKTVVAEGPDIVGTVEASKITEIEATQAIVVNYTVGNTVSVKYTVPESLAEYLDITCKNGTLKCRFKDISAKLDNRQVIVEVVAPNVSAFEASSSAAINTFGKLTVNTLEIEASSAASVNIAQAEAKSVEIDSSSSASVSVKGSLGNVDAEASSAAIITLAGTIAQLDAEASSAGKLNASNAKISAGSLEATSAGAIVVSAATDTPFKTKKSSAGTITIK